MRDAGGGLLRRFEEAVSHPEGSYGIVWDGRLEDGGPAPEGALQAVIRVEDPAGAAAAQQLAIALTLDRTAPLVAISLPASSSVVPLATQAHGTIQDPNLHEYVLTAERPFSAAVELARGTQSVVDADLASLATLTEGPYQLVVTAEDAAENRAELRVPFTLDATDPHALIASPAPGSFLDRGPSPVSVTGTATDAHLESYQLQYGAGTAPADFVSISTGTQVVASGPLGSWSVAHLSDGPYVLDLVVRDRAGQSAESRSAIVLDGLAPEAAIDAPAPQADLNAPATIRGTASDANLASWRLEAAPGDASTAFQWSMLAEGDATVTHGVLASWEPLPPDGLHTLRLTAADRAGHTAAAVRTVTIDTVPPPAPASLEAVVHPAAGLTGDVTLTWPAVAAGDLRGYTVSRNGVGLTPEPIASAEYTDTSRPEGTYLYEVRAQDRAGNASAPASRTVHVDRTPPTVALLAPAPGASVSGSIEVRGTAFSLDDFAGFRLSVGTGATPVDWAAIAQSTVPVSAGVLGTWTPSVPGPHVLALEAEDQAGNQARITVAVTVDHAPPGPPVLMSVSNVPQPTTLTATWQASLDPDTVGYLVYRNGHLANAPAVVIGDLHPYLVSGPAYADTSLPDGSHCYRVVAMDGAGNVSVPSNEICRSLDNHPPHAVLVEPPDGTRFEFPLRLVAVTPDLDVASVRFEYTPASQSAWTQVAAPDALPPYEATLDPAALAPGEYRVRAVAAGAGGRAGIPSPAPITVTYRRRRRTLCAIAAAGVRGRRRGLAQLGPQAPSPTWRGFHVYRDGERLTATPQSQPTFAEARPLGVYEYAVTAVDQDATGSLPATVEAFVYRPFLAPVIPPVTGGPVTLTGESAQPGGTMEILRLGVVVGQAPATSAGTFAVPGIPLQPGPNLLSARERSAAGGTSLPSEDVVAIAGAEPHAVSGLHANVSGLDVSLEWDPLDDPDVFGYHVRRNVRHHRPVLAGRRVAGRREQQPRRAPSAVCVRRAHGDGLGTGDGGPGGGMARRSSGAGPGRAHRPRFRWAGRSGRGARPPYRGRVAGPGAALAGSARGTGLASQPHARPAVRDRARSRTVGAGDVRRARGGLGRDAGRGSRRRPPLRRDGVRRAP